ncbi:MAG: acetyl-CoA carboxylase, carboxyltransferase subunit beta [Candidatus Neomarinimicrobiota bacterium]|jgi:acetyl-CoA carboxylase carboxyl transferase subunit beta|nr:acetyl-CoA carboxylase, carboxyltransferase subunit beta [Candidatus Neomarinimicrobiota bacterium]|tara:strand:- start:730 stop:1569 length:840 start_codon:yes stop_codon:yes gene_type:complete
MAWFSRKDKNISTDASKKDIPSGLWTKCPSCSEIQYKPELEKTFFVCSHCSHHFRMTPNFYFDLLVDSGSSVEIFNKIKSVDHLEFQAEKKYSSQLTTAIEKTGKNDAISCVEAKVDKKDVILGVMNFSFIGGSMGSAVGEIVARCIDVAREKKKPFILICSSGGARMQESALSLMQLAKTSSKLAKFHEEGGLYIPVLTDPTTGGVTASYGMLGDVILAEPGALIGFAGPRVIKQTIGEDLPEGFQTSEFLLEKGFVDHIVPRSKMKTKLSSLIHFLS